MERRVFLKLVAGMGTAMATGGARAAAQAERPFLRTQLIFPLHALHNHSSCVVELRNGELLTCWYRGSGERTADDVQVLGSRRPRGARAWSEPFLMADHPEFPDCNPAMFVHDDGKLSLFWVTIIANEWHSGLLRHRVANRPERRGAPRWDRDDVILMKPGPEFTQIVQQSVTRDLGRLEELPADLRERAKPYLETRAKNSADKYFSRMGWMPRAHPTRLRDGRIVLPLYSDGFDFSLMALSDDDGRTWQTSLPLVGQGPVQPTVVERTDGTLVAYMRDNGPPPKRLMVSESRDRGHSWSPVRDSDIPNPGSGAEAIRLHNGHWALINNDTERGRHRLALWVSEDEGRTWPHRRYLERDESGEGAGSFGYPSLIQARGGSLHATYTYTAPRAEQQRDSQGRPLHRAIKHAHFNEAWIRQS
jgi:predicted neuraminidase